MILGIVVDVPGNVLLFDAAYAMFQPRGSGNRVWARQCLFLTRIRHEVGRICNELDFDPGKFVDFRESPGLGAVSEVAVRKIKDRHHIFESQPHGFNCHIETISRCRRRDNDCRAFTVAAPHGLEQVGLLSFRRQPRRWPAALHVDDHQRQFGHDRQTDRLLFQRNSRPRSSGEPDVSRKAGANCRTHSGDFIFSLKGLYSETLMTRQFMKNVGSRSDWIGAVK